MSSKLLERLKRIPPRRLAWLSGVGLVLAYSSLPFSLFYNSIEVQFTTGEGAEAEVRLITHRLQYHPFRASPFDANRDFISVEVWWLPLMPPPWGSVWWSLLPIPVFLEIAAALRGWRAAGQEFVRIASGVFTGAPLLIALATITMSFAYMSVLPQFGIVPFALGLSCCFIATLISEFRESPTRLDKLFIAGLRKLIGRRN